MRSVERPDRRRILLDAAAVALLLGVGIAGFWPTFGGGTYLGAALGALVVGLALAILGAWHRWGILVLAALTVLAYFVLGGALALPHTAAFGFLPTIDTLRQLAIGVVTSWKALLTTVAPVAPADGHLLVPFLLTLVAAVLATSLALRLVRPLWALLITAAYLALQIALGMSQPAQPVVQGLVFAVVAIVWLALRAAWAPERQAISIDGDRAAGRHAGGTMRRLVAGGAVLVVAACAGVATSALASPNEPRYVLRDVIIPPFDLHKYPSPLQSYRTYVKDHAEEALFTVSGLPEGARVRLGTMDAYNGVVYDVSDEGAGASSAFTPIRSNMSPDATGTPASLEVEIGAYEGVWLPGVGAVTDVTFEGDRADELRRSAFYNESTGTGVVTARLREGDAYTLTGMIPTAPEDTELAGLDFAPVTMPSRDDVPEGLAEIAADAVVEAGSPIERVRALEAFLSEGGFFSHGLEGQVFSRPGHGSQRIATMLGADQMVGDDEQYAVAMALMAGELGIPARVVMGFYPEEGDESGDAFAATGDTLHAWVEVAFDEVGWVTFDPTPPEDQVPNDQTTKPKADPKPQVLQPPPPPQEPVDLPPLVPDDREAEDESNPIGGILGIILAIGGGLLLLVVLLLAPFIVIGALKAARRRKRWEAERASDRISGGWDELMDRAVDYGTSVPPGGTRAEDAGVVAVSIAEPRVTVLASRADAEVFGPAEPSTEEIDVFWSQVDEIVGGIGERSSFWKRTKARLNLRSLLNGSRVSTALRAVRDLAAQGRKDGHR